MESKQKNLLDTKARILFRLSKSPCTWTTLLNESNVSKKTLAYALNHLEKKGFVMKNLVSEGGRVRTLYTITAQGRDFAKRIRLTLYVLRAPSEDIEKLSAQVGDDVE